MQFFMTPVNFHTLDVIDAVMYNIMFSEKQYAKKLLEYSDLNVLQMCMESGFKEYYGMSPGNYKKKNMAFF